MAQVESLKHDTDFKAWDLVLQKNEALQSAPWSLMTPEEQKAAYYLAWGPKMAPDYTMAKAVTLRVVVIIGLTLVVYVGLQRWFRSKKQTPTLTPEWREDARKRLVENRSSPYYGVSAHLFTKDGIKEDV